MNGLDKGFAVFIEGATTTHDHYSTDTEAIAAQLTHIEEGREFTCVRPFRIEWNESEFEMMYGNRL